MELKEIRDGKYNIISGMLIFNTNQGEIKMRAVEALEIVYTLYDYCRIDYSELKILEDRLLDDIDVERS